MTRRSLIPILCIALYLVGCGPSDTSSTATWTGSVDTLPSGTIVVRNPAVGTWPGVRPLTEDLRLGTAAGEGPELFGRIRDIDVDEAGRIYVLDGQAHEIRVFGADGAHVRTFGGTGNGPGELAGPTGMEWGPDQRLWVEDPDNNRYSVYDTTGAIITSHPRDLSWYGFAWTGSFDDAGRLYLEQLSFGPDGTESWLVWMDSAMVAHDSFPVPKYEQLTYKLMRNGLVRSGATVPFSPRLTWTVARDGTLWFGITGDYRLYQRSLAGDTLRIIEREYEPIPVTRAERDEALAQDFLRNMADQGADIDPDRVPANRPVWSGFNVDAEGRLWIVPQIPDSTSTALDVFSSDGRYLGRLKLDSRIKSAYPGPVIRDDYLYAVAQDELGVDYVVRARLGMEEWKE